MEMRPPSRRAIFPFLGALAIVIVACLTLFRKRDMSAASLQLRHHHPDEFVAEAPQEGVAADDTQEEQSSLGQESWAPQAGEGPHQIRYIALIAERHSGSTWMVNLLNSYFKHKNITVTSTLCTWKHWFQDRIHEDTQSGKRECRQGQLCPACMDMKHTLVVAMWRNPYDWISGMQKIPHHAIAHAGITDMSEFMTKTWMLNPDKERAARKDALNKARDEKPCMDNFLPWEVLPCDSKNRNAIYELDPDGEAYGNLYELRKAKIRDFNAVEKWAPHYERILYEDMLVGDGLTDWLHSLDTKYGLSGKYETVPSPGLRAKMEVSRYSMYYLNSDKCAPQCSMGGLAGEKALETLHGMWDTQLEGELGYHKVGDSTRRHRALTSAGLPRRN